jgi:hypothetical protein
MYTLNLLHSLSKKPLLRLVRNNIIGLILILNIGACKNYHIGKASDNASNLEMTISKTLLIGTEKKIKTVFKIYNEKHPVLLSDFKLKVSMLGEETFTGLTTGSKISHQVSTNEKKDFIGSFEKGLTEFTTLLELGSASGQNKLTVDFDLLPAQEAIKVKLLLELVDKTGKIIRAQEVKWIKDAISISSPAIFEGVNTLIVLKSLEKDIEDPSKIVLQLKSDEEKAHFYFRNSGQSVATLEELLGGTSKIFSEKATNPIEIAVNAEGSVHAAKVTIMVFNANAIDDSHPLGKKEMYWNGVKLNQKDDQNQQVLKRDHQGQDSKKGISELQHGQQLINNVDRDVNETISVQQELSQQQELDKPLQTVEIASAVEGANNNNLDDIQKEERALEDKIDNLQQREEAAKQKDDSKPDNSLKIEEKQIEKDVKKFMVKLNRKEKKELKGKSRKEREAIRQQYRREKEEIRKKLQEANKNLKDRREHTRGFLNALGHNMLGIHLKSDTSRSALYKEGQLNGHRAAVVLGRTETALGGTLTSVGVATLVAGTGPTLGGAAVGSAALIGAGLAGVAHGIAAAERAQANLARAKEAAASEKDDTSHETSHHVHIETQGTEEASVKVKGNGEKS